MATYGILSSFPPTRCGLATFADALGGAMTSGLDSAVVVRVLDNAEATTPTPTRDEGSTPVVATMVHGDTPSMDAAVRALNATDVAVIQHEYGIYGGTDGDEVLAVMRALTVPTIAVLHTVLDAPTPGQRRVLEEVVSLARATVVMSRTALTRLGAHYDVDIAPASVIPHGITPPRPTSPADADTSSPVILTWGLLGPGKGIEWGIHALTHLRHLDPTPTYRVLGQTHPKVVAREGERYRDGLVRLARTLGHERSFDLHSHYLDRETLARHVAQASVVLLPYDSRVQITSGVLAEAVAAGKPVVATAFPHAVELLAGGAGTVVRHGDPRAMAQALEDILTRPRLARAMAARGLAYGETASWAAVGERFRTLAHQITSQVAA